MKRIKKQIDPSFYGVNHVAWMLKLIVIVLISSNLQAQTFVPTVSGGWDGAKYQGSGYNDYGNGVVRLLNNTADGCEGAGVYETTSQYFPCAGNFSKCYQVVFGCDDAGADGLAFMFSTCSAVADYQVWGCGGGLGYVDACPGNKGITIEFDTYNNGGVDDFDTGYEGTGTQDQIAIHKNMQAKTGPGKITGTAVPNLEDGLEHTVCISYDNTTHVLAVTIDGISRISYDMDNAAGGGMDLETYFGCVGVNQSWTSGTNGGTNYEVVSNGASIYNNAGQVCPQMLPVEFLYVEAQKISSSVLVSWATATELNNKTFIIERSSDASSWEAIGEVAGAGNSSSILTYNFTDEHALNGTNYYRIRQVDVDGAFLYSNIVTAQISSNQVNILPNPFEESFTILTDIAGSMEVVIHDVLGRVVYQSSKVVENGTLHIIPELIPGMYIVTLSTDSFTEHKEIIRK
jgi:hypothetical protein